MSPGPQLSGRDLQQGHSLPGLDHIAILALQQTLPKNWKRAFMFGDHLCQITQLLEQRGIILGSEWGESLDPYELHKLKLIFHLFLTTHSRFVRTEINIKITHNSQTWKAFTEQVEGSSLGIILSTDSLQTIKFYQGDLNLFEILSWI